jgi:hypothetical protein
VKDDPTRDIGGGAGGTHPGDRVQGRSPAGDAAPDPYESLKNFLNSFFSFVKDDPDPVTRGLCGRDPPSTNFKKVFIILFLF